MTKKQIIIMIILISILISGVLVFIFVPRDKIAEPQIIEVEETVYVDTPKKDPSGIEKINIENQSQEQFTKDINTVLDPNEVKENADYMNFENTIDRLIEVTNR